MKTQIAAVVLLAASLVTGCSAPSAAPATSPAYPATSASPAAASGTVVERLGLQGKSAQQIVEQLDRSQTQRPLDFKASVRPGELILGDETSEQTLAIPADSFYLSIAPYVTRTHECFFHSLATCQGELSGRTVEVTITDASGKVLADGPATTYTNGFVGYWLPRGITGTIEAKYEGKTATTPFATNDDSPTCLTTLKLT